VASTVAVAVVAAVAAVAAVVDGTSVAVADDGDGVAGGDEEVDGGVADAVDESGEWVVDKEKVGRPSADRNEPV